MPDILPTTPPAAGPASAEPEIHVIPDKFYGAALKAHVQDVKKEPAPPANGLVQPPKRSMLMPVIGGAVVVVLLIGGVFIYLNQSLLFKPATPTPTPTPVVTPTPTPEPPAAASGLSATSVNPQSASVSWIDNASNESGYRIERAEGASGTFVGLTSLPPNSTSFQDVAVTASTTYRYRVIAVNQTGESAPSAEVSVTVAALPPPVPAPPKLPPAGLDTDSDGLSDIEEALFGTSPRNPDTDEDGFLDGNELFNLYNPNGRAPGTLIQAGLVKQVQGSIGWTMYIPTPWTITLTDPDGSKATIDTGHPEKFAISIEDNPNNLSIVDWFMQSHPTAELSQILQFRSKKGYQGIISPDQLTTYIPWGGRVFVFTYVLDDQPFISYRTTYSMMLNSLVLTGLPQNAPVAASQPLPFEPAATTTGVITQPEAVFPISGTETTGTTQAATTSTP